MSNDDARPEITGETTVTLGDQFKAFYWIAPWLWWTLAGCFLVVLLTSWGGYGDSDSFFNTLSSWAFASYFGQGPSSSAIGG